MWSQKDTNISKEYIAFNLMGEAGFCTIVVLLDDRTLHDHCCKNLKSYIRSLPFKYICGVQRIVATCGSWPEIHADKAQQA
jgi:hypothetical protein